jgi:hypothetical protein
VNDAENLDITAVYNELGNSERFSGIQSYLLDIRDFPQVIAHWKAHEKVENNSEFLYKTGLDLFFTPESFETLLTNTSSVGTRLAHQMALCLPSYGIRRNETVMEGINPGFLQYTAQAWRDHHPLLPIIDYN